MEADRKLESKIVEFNGKLDDVRSQVHKIIVGQDKIIDSILKALICNGHVLLEGVPGIAKTLTVLSIVKTIEDAVCQRIQFTPDLLPTDITGITVFDEKRGFYTIKGPVFANIVIGDEINRTPPKVQSAMLQAMQEKEVTIGKQTMALPKPFFVLATQNPLETRGVYPLPEAQVDRFLFKINMVYIKKEEEAMLVHKNVEVKSLEEYKLKPVITLKDITDMQELVKKIYMSKEVKRYIVSMVNATRRPSEYGIQEAKFLRWGGSPRATINLARGSRATAMMKGRNYVMPEDVRETAHDVLRHRIILNYEGKARSIQPDAIVNAIIKKVPVL